MVRINTNVLNCKIFLTFIRLHLHLFIYIYVGTFVMVIIYYFSKLM
jgi:hypothetical protein